MRRRHDYLMPRMPFTGLPLTFTRNVALCAVSLLYACSSIRGQTVTMEDLDQLSVRVHQSNLSDREKQEFDEVKVRANNGEYAVRS
jgi:hypothetical protein